MTISEGERNMYFEEFPKEISENLDRLYSSLLCDVMDRMGYWNQTMTHEIKPLDPESKVFGRARTVKAVEVEKPPENAYELEIEVVDSLKPGDVLVVTQSGYEKASFWGELLSNACVGRGARGIMIDGYTRDSKGIIELGFPCFVKGKIPADSYGRIDVVSYDVPIECGGVKVEKGDYIFGDMDGVVVIPKGIILEVLEKAVEKMKGEDNVRKELREGVSVKEVFLKYGIL
jgi:4-hydroxy-4-methyl-2-oxoglutarate aldolase